MWLNATMPVSLLKSLNRYKHWKLWPCPHTCPSSSCSHVKLKVATNVLFKVPSKMVLKCVTKLFPWCGQGIYGEVVFPLDRGLYNQKLLYDTCIDVKRKTTEKKKKQPPPPHQTTSYLHLYQDKNLPGYFLHQAMSLPSVSKDHKIWPEARKVEAGIVQSRENNCNFAISIPVLTLSGFVHHLSLTA